jgi:phage tail-like protein
VEPLSLPNPDRWSKIVNDYPLPAYNYRVSVGGTDVAFSEVSGLKMEYNTVVYKHGMSYLTGPQVLRGEPVINTIVLKRGVVHRRHELADWISKDETRDIFIDLCNETGKALIRWSITGAMPVKIETSGFSADSNEVVIESIELVAHKLKIEYLA